jgi:hypothetical protein
MITFDELMFNSVFIVFFSLGRSVISVVLPRRPGHRRRHDLLLLLLLDSFRRRPCYGRLCCYWLERSFRYRRHQILLRLAKRN